MSLSRAELEKLLADLDAAMPALMVEFPDPERFNPAFAALADAITDNASIEDDDWAFERIDEILDRYGLGRPDEDA